MPVRSRPWFTASPIRPKGRAASTVGTATLAAMLLGACDSTTSPPFTPFGNDADVYGEWDVNTMIPDATFCADASIDEVGIVFFETGGDVAYESPRFRFPCADGFFDSGDERLLAAGTYEYQWRAYSGGVPLLYSLHYSVNVVPGVEFVFTAVDTIDAASSPPRPAVLQRTMNRSTKRSCSSNGSARRTSAPPPIVT